MKIFRLSDDKVEADKQRERVSREIQAISKLNHTNVIKILDFDPYGEWYVSKFYSSGDLQHNKEQFKGDLISTLKAIRPIVECVSILHRERAVHRDIKPRNIFIDKPGSLILGDFGIVAIEDQTRLSDTFMGSRDWCAPWISTVIPEKIPPSADVFSIAKVIWAMLSGQNVLPFWDWSAKEYNVEALFPNRPNMILANNLFAKCIVRHAKDCLKDGTTLLAEIDSSITKIELGLLDPDNPVCRFCHKGKYFVFSKESREKTLQFGLNSIPVMRPDNIPGGEKEVGGKHKILVCDTCGHSQIFFFEFVEAIHIREKRLKRVGKINRTSEKG